MGAYDAMAIVCAIQVLAMPTWWCSLNRDVAYSSCGVAEERQVMSTEKRPKGKEQERAGLIRARAP